MRNQLLNSITYGTELDMMYIANNGKISKRRVNVIKVNDETFQAYCYLRKSKRLFRYSNVLAVIPVVTREREII